VVNFEYGNFKILISKKCYKSGNLVPQIQHIVTVREGDECMPPAGLGKGIVRLG